MAQKLARRVKDRLDADGVNLLNSCGRAAWQTVFHFHVHVIPRYDGDPLRLPWLPAPGDPRRDRRGGAATHRVDSSTRLHADCASLRIAFSTSGPAHRPVEM